MTPRGGQMLQLPIGDGWLHAVLTLPADARAALLVLPPFFHEWQRSYRMFALLADHLARRGVAALRFDYRGSGDSSGADTDFLPGRALEDAHVAFRALAGRTSAPITLLGVRAGALLAERLGERVGRPWFAWQAVTDGRTHFEALAERDERECNNRMRFPFRGRPQPRREGQLMGHRLHPEFALEIGIFRRGSTPALVIDAEPRCTAGDLALPPSLSSWVDEVDLHGSLPTAIIDALAARLAARLVDALPDGARAVA